MTMGLLIIRLIVGLLFVGHGTQKLFGWFGGHAIEGTAGFMGSLGLRPGRFWAMIGGLTETVGGLLVALGFLTPFGAAALIGMMTVATLTVHVRNGVWNTNGGYELPLVYMGAATLLAFAGPGAWSFDNALDLHLSGWFFGVFALLLGTMTGAVVVAIREPAVIAEERAADAEDRRAA